MSIQIFERMASREISAQEASWLIQAEYERERDQIAPKWIRILWCLLLTAINAD